MNNAVFTQGTLKLWDLKAWLVLKGLKFGAGASRLEVNPWGDLIKIGVIRSAWPSI